MAQSHRHPEKSSNLVPKNACSTPRFGAEPTGRWSVPGCIPTPEHGNGPPGLFSASRSQYISVGGYLLLLLSIWTLAFPTAQASKLEDRVSEYRLDNGLKLVVVEDHRAPVAIAQVWYRVGSSYESGGITGVSHVLEHMLFLGTEKLPPNEYSRIIAALGGAENAFTGTDYTAYYAEIAVEHLDRVLALEADRMRNARMDANEFKRELEVVKEERRLRTEDNAKALTYEAFQAAAWNAGPYRQPVIGWMSDLDSLTIEDVRTWYRYWYAPDNAVVVVVGDVRPEAVHRLVETHFGALEPEAPPAVKPRGEPQQRGEKRIVVRAPAKLPYLLMGYKAPGRAGLAKDREPWEPYALKVLAEILDGGESSRFSQQLVRGDEIAVQAGAGYSAFTRLDTLFTLVGVPAQGHDAAGLEAAFRREIRRLQDEPVRAEELQRVKTRVVAADVFARDSIHAQANEVGTLEAIGLGWRELDAYLPGVRAVTAEQVQAVARKYLVPDRLTVAVLDPQPLDTAKPRSRGFSTGRH